MTTMSCLTAGSLRVQVTDAVLSDRWADAVEAEEADAKASKFARWFKKTEGTLTCPPNVYQFVASNNLCAGPAVGYSCPFAVLRSMRSK
jgi:hypothetical protein